MDKVEQLELVVIPSIGIGHLVPTVEFAKLLIARDSRFSITIIIIPPPFPSPSTSYIQSIVNSLTNIRFIELPLIPPPASSTGFNSSSLVLESHKPQVQKILAELKENPVVSLAGVVVDLFTTQMIDFANELGIPSYLYFTCGAAMLGFTLHLPILDKEISTDFKDHVGDLRVPGYVNPVSPFCAPEVLLTRGDGYEWFLFHARNCSKAKGIIVNTVYEVESFAVELHSNGMSPPVYPVGPILNFESVSSGTESKRIMKWLDDQPPSSVIFLCFGSKGSFDEAQVKEIAMGLEQSGHRFLWSLRKPAGEKFGIPTEYTNLEDILPEGFLQRTAGRGLICGWAPQVAVLAHKTIGGFVSHCGWNSVMESLWYGVPILTWPLYAEQKLNASLMVKDLGLAVGLRITYTNGVDLVTAEEIATGVKCVMDKDNAIRLKVTEMKEICRKAKSPGGSSFASLGRFIEDAIARV